MNQYRKVFPELTREDLSEVMDVIQTVELDYGIDLIHHGEEDHTALVLLEGEVSLRRDDVEIAVVRPGELLGEMEFFAPLPRLCDAKVVAPCRALVIERDGYMSLHRSGNAAANHIERMVLAQAVSRLRRYHVRISELSRGTRPVKKLPQPGFMERMAASLGMMANKEAKDLDKVAALASFPAFEDADPTVLMEVGASLGARQFKEGQVICRYGEPATSMFFLAAGAVEVLMGNEEDKGTPLAVLEPGDIFGFTSMFAGRDRMASCLAHTDTVVLTLEKHSWDALVQSPERAASVLRCGMAADLGLQARAALVQLSSLEASVRHEVADRLQELADEEPDKEVPLHDLYFKD